MGSTMYLANIFGLEPMLIVLILVLVLFGGSKIPELMRGLGRGVGELHKGINESKQQFQQAMQEEPATQPITPAAEAQPRQASDATSAVESQTRPS